MKALSCPYSVTTKGGQEQFPGKTLGYSLQVSVWLLLEGGVYFIGKPADINDGWIRYVRTIHRGLLDADNSTHNLSVPQSAMEKSCTIRTALALAQAQ